MITHKQIDSIQQDLHEATMDASRLSALKDQHIYITGAGGFVGSWLLEYVSYLNRVHHMNIRATASTRSWQATQQQRPHLARQPWLTMETREVENLLDIPNDVSYVLHLAGTPDHRTVSSNPLKVMRGIVQGTDRTLEAASRLPNLQKLLNLSSGHAAGHQPMNPAGASEKDYFGSDCASLHSTYSEAKRSAENICQIYRSQLRMPVITMRPFAFIGPYQLLERPWAINNFIRDAISQQNISIQGNSQTLRSYMYPSDMVYHMLCFLLDGQPGATLNLGSSEAYSLKEVANLIADKAPGNVRIETTPHEARLPLSCFVPNTHKAAQEYALTTTVPLDLAIEKTLHWLALGQKEIAA